MKRIYLLLAVVLCAAGMSAQMRVWSNGQKLFELNLASIDSITFVKPGDSDTVPPINPDTTVIPPDTTAASGFDYYNWRKQTNISIYGMDKPVALPWASGTQTSMPDEYKHPEKEFQADSITPKWQLAFNLCDSASLPGVDMFGLWDAHSQRMRIYTYVESLANPNAHSCFYQITSSVPAFVDNDTKGWMPADSTIKTCNWGTTMGSSLPVPSTTTRQLLPITGTLDGQINQGWICYELDFTTGIFTVNRDANMTFALYAVEQIGFTGDMTLKGTMESYGGKITIPGNQNKLMSGILKVAGNLFSSLSSGIATGAKSGAAAGAAVAGGGFLGGVCSALGGTDGGQKEYTLDLNFNIAQTGQINGGLSSNLGTTVSPAQIDFSMLFDQIIKHSANPNATSFSTGAWNLKQQPIIYVSDDFRFYTYDTNVPDYFLHGAKVRHPYLSFLDPTSIELMLNTDSTLFPYHEIDTVKVLGYDFIFSDTAYTLPAQPYYDFYNIRQDSVFTGGSGRIDVIEYGPGLIEYIDSLEYLAKKCFLLDTAATLHILTTQNAEFFGDTLPITGNGMNVYDQLLSPGVASTADNKLSTIGVAVVMEIVFKNGDRRIFADRFLPQYKSFTIRDAVALYDTLQNATAPTSMGSITLEYPLFEVQKQKALRMMQDEVGYLTGEYPIVFTEDDSIAVCVRKYQNADTLGLAVMTSSQDNLGTLPKVSELEYLRQVVNDKIDDINEKMSRFHMCYLDVGLDDNAVGHVKCLDSDGSVKYFEFRNGTASDSLPQYYQALYYIKIYQIDANGNLTPFNLPNQ